MKSFFAFLIAAALSASSVLAFTTSAEAFFFPRLETKQPLIQPVRYNPLRGIQPGQAPGVRSQAEQPFAAATPMSASKSDWFAATLGGRPLFTSSTAATSLAVATERVGR